LGGSWLRSNQREPSHLCLLRFSDAHPCLITDAAEVKKILRHLIKIGKPLPGLDPDSLN
jgi:hypothetical protein